MRLAGDQIVSALRVKVSLHEAGLQELLGASALRGTLPRWRVLWGVTPASIGWGTDLSDVVSRAVGEVVASVVHKLRDWGVHLRPREPSCDSDAAPERCVPLPRLPPWTASGLVPVPQTDVDRSRRKRAETALWMK